MNVTLGWWALPIFATALTWVVIVLQPEEQVRDYGFPVQTVFLFFLGVLLTVIYWMFYFGIGWWLS